MQTKLIAIDLKRRNFKVISRLSSKWFIDNLEEKIRFLNKVFINNLYHFVF